MLRILERDPDRRYDNRSCPLINADADRVSRRAIYLPHAQDSMSTGNAVLRGNDAVIVWPIVTFKGDAQVARSLLD